MSMYHILNTWDQAMIVKRKMATLLLVTYSFQSNSIHIRIQIAPYDQSGRMGPSESLLSRNVTSCSIVKKLRWQFQVACNLKILHYCSY